MKCPNCGFEYHEKVENDDKMLCAAWANKHTLNKEALPSKEQFDAMQREGYLPTHDERDGRKWELHHGHYGWAVDYDWLSIATKIKRKTLLAA